VFGENFGELRREALLAQLHQRVRDVAQGPDGNIYVLTDGPEHAVLRIEPSE
jgi:glucose/arabinose dehydrogenase